MTVLYVPHSPQTVIYLIHYELRSHGTEVATTIACRPVGLVIEPIEVG